MGFTSVSIHTQFRSSFSLTKVTSRHLSTFSLQTPPSTKMPLLLWFCFAQTPMPTPTSASTTCSSCCLQSIHKFSIPYPPSELLYTNYQLPLRLSGSNITMFQSGEDDKDGFSAWSMFGCGHDDLLVYDREGRLYKHLPSKSSYRKLNFS